MADKTSIPLKARHLHEQGAGNQQHTGHQHPEAHVVHPRQGHYPARRSIIGIIQLARPTKAGITARTP